jgi:hypothetical protein
LKRRYVFEHAQQYYRSSVAISLTVALIPSPDCIPIGDLEPKNGKLSHVLDMRKIEHFDFGQNALSGIPQSRNTATSEQNQEVRRFLTRNKSRPMLVR